MHDADFTGDFVGEGVGRTILIENTFRLINEGMKLQIGREYGIGGLFDPNATDKMKKWYTKTGKN